MASTWHSSALHVVTDARPRAATPTAEPKQGSWLQLTPRYAPMRAHREKWADRRVKTKVFVSSFVLNLAAAFVLAYHWDIGSADGLSRTANAWYVLFSRDPHLAAIGFVWPALPSLVQLPLLPFARLLGHPEVAGFLMSALSGAAVLAALAALLGTLGVTGWTRLLWLATVQFHPQFWYLAASGLAELPFTLFICLALIAFLKLPQRDAALAGLGISLAVAFYIRYEALGFLVGFAALVAFLSAPSLGAAEPRGSVPASARERLRRLPRRAWSWLRGERELLEGRLLVVMAPSLYGVLLWLLMNWLIMGDPLYFQHSEFSLNAAFDVARNYGPAHPLYAAIGSLPITGEYAIKRLAQVHVALPILAVFAVWASFTRRAWRLLGLVALVASAVAFTSAQVFVGTLPNYIRYWSYATPFAIVLAAGCLYAYRDAPPRRSRALRLATSALLLAGCLVNAEALADPTAAVDERRLAAELHGDHALSQELAKADIWWIRRHDAALLAPVLDRLSRDGLTLIDIETAYPTLLRAQHPERLVIASDRDFNTIVQNPRQYLRYIALTDPSFGGARDLVNEHYPGLFEGQVPWARPLAEIPGTIQPWRIYEIAATASGNASKEQ